MSEVEKAPRKFMIGEYETVSSDTSQLVVSIANVTLAWRRYPGAKDELEQSRNTPSTFR